MPEVLTETEPEAICVECKTPFTFANSKAVKTRDSVMYCSPNCEAGLNIEGKRRALERDVIEACKAEHEAAVLRNSQLANWNDLTYYAAIDKRAAAVKALLDFESQQIKK